MSTPRRSPAQIQYLQAGERVLGKAADTLRVLTRDQVCNEAGRSAQAFQQVWRNHNGFTGYKEALVRYVTQIDRFSGLDTISQEIASLATAANLVESIRAFCQFNLEVIRDAPDTGTLLLLLAGQPDPETQSALRDLYHDFDSTLVTDLEPVLAAWRREPLPPLEVHDLATIFNVLIDGISLRARFDQDCATADRYATAVLALLRGLTRERGSARTFEEVTSQLNDNGQRPR